MRKRPNSFIVMFMLILGLSLWCVFIWGNTQQSGIAGNSASDSKIPCNSRIWQKVLTYQAARKRSGKAYDDLQAGRCSFKEWQSSVHDEYEAQEDLERELDK